MRQEDLSTDTSFSKMYVEERVERCFEEVWKKMQRKGFVLYEWWLKLDKKKAKKFIKIFKDDVEERFIREIQRSFGLDMGSNYGN